MELRQIAYVLEVAKHKNFSKAADALYVTQPAISQQIRALEEELQVHLFKRDSHGVSLTKDGERFINYANDVMEASDRLLEAFNQSTASKKETINIGVFPFYKATGFRKVINSFFASTANVLGNFKVMENYEALDSVVSGDIDFALIKTRLENLPDSVTYDVLDSERLVAMIKRDSPNLNGDTINVTDLGKFPLLTGDNKSHYYIEMKEFYKKNNVEFNVAFMNTFETDLMLDMVESGTGIWLLTERVAEVLETDLAKAYPIEPPQDFSIVLVYSKNRKLRGKSLAFRNYVLDSYNPDKFLRSK